MIEQLSVFLENKQGRMAHLTGTLAAAGVNIVSLSVSDTAHFGIMRALVDDPGRAAQALKQEGFTVNTTQVLACEVPDSPGGLVGVVQALSDNAISVEYLYSFVRHPGKNALIVFHVDDVAKASQVLRESGCRLLEQNEVLAY
nr:ACT domain-containing protein [bacterium]